jgi:Mitochondrial ribosomal subunit protein
LRPK